MNHSRWNLLPPAPDKLLVADSGLPPLILQLLYNRGFTEPSQCESFINGDDSPSGDPFLLPGMQQAVARVYRALLAGEKIAIYGDFDADGIAGTALLVQGLSFLGSEAIPYIPHRLTEGYGLKTAALETLHKQGVSLVITVDCGITAISEVEKAKKMGIDIVITDHHTPLAEIPPALAIVNPKLPDSTYPFSELTGVGVALKLLQALFQSVGREKQLDELMDLVALGTIADMAPLLGENRYLVKQGLELINTSPRLGIREMITQAGLEIGNIESGSISWVLAPRLNAAGRLAHAMTSYKLLMTESPQEAQGLTKWLEQKNTERQKLTASVLTRAREQIIDQGILPLLVATGKDYPVGIVGLVAGRLAEEFYRPTIVIKKGERMSSGSCRSIPEFNIILALNQCSGLLTQFGGHSQAAGFSLPTENISRLREALLQSATTQLDGVDLRPRLDVDVEITLPELGEDTFNILQQLAPFGCGNPLPVFLSHGVEVIDCRTMGSTEEHLRMSLRQGGTIWDGVGFRLGSCLAEVSSRLDIVYNLELDRWNGEEKLRLNIQDFTEAK